MNILNTISLLFVIAQALCQRRELETDLLAIARAHVEVTPDNPDDALDIGVGLMITKINDIDIQKEMLDVNGWLHLQWTDERYQWNPKDYGNITSISVPCKDFPKPDVELFNGAEDGLTIHGPVNCIVTSDGHITYIPLVLIHSICPIADPTTDTFNCHFHLGSWTHNCRDVNLIKSKSELDTSHMQDSWRFEILNHSSEIISKKYTCCPENYCSVKLHLSILDRSRTPRSKYYYQSQCH